MLMLCSYQRATEVRDTKKSYAFFLSEKLISLKDRLLNLLYFSTLSMNDKEILVDNIFKINSFIDRISY